MISFTFLVELFFTSFQWKSLIKFSSISFYSSTVPPNIDDSLSSSDVIVREGSNITLKCRAHGSPQPTIKWKRDDNSKININKSLSGEENSYQLFNFLWKLIEFSMLSFAVYEWDAEMLEISRISRLDMGAYLCIAQNSVPPSVSKRIKVSVDCKHLIHI